MPTIAPWLEPPNFLAAAEAGARIGQQQSQFAAEQLLKQQELAANTGLGYARLGSENQRAQAEQAQANARMALQQGHYSDLNNLGQERLQQGDERLADLQTQRGAANDLKQQGLDLQTNKFGVSSDQRQQEIDLNTNRFMAKGANPKEAGEQAVIAADAGFGFLTDPEHETNPKATLEKYPGASSSKSVIDWLNKRNLTPTTTTTTSFPNNTEQRTTIKSEPSSALQSGGLPAQKKVIPANQAPPGNYQPGDRAAFDGAPYKFDGKQWVQE